MIARYCPLSYRDVCGDALCGDGTCRLVRKTYQTYHPLPEGTWSTVEQPYRAAAAAAAPPLDLRRGPDGVWKMPE